jgi:hypothetical protein
MNTTAERYSGRNLTILALYAVALVCGATWLAAYDDQNARLSLSSLKPFIDWLLPWGRVIEERSNVLLPYAQLFILGFGGLVVASALMWRSRATSERVAFIMAGLLGMYAQISLGLSHTTVGIYCYIACAILLLAYLLLRQTSFTPGPASRQPITAWEVGIFIVIFTIAVLIRYYALNYLFDYFEGEEAPFTMAGSDFLAAARANMGDDGPWSPFGLIYYVLVYIPTKLFGYNVLSMRFGSTVPAMIIFTLMYFFVRDIAGRGAAIATVMVLAIDAKQISWGRYEFPHIATSMTAVAIVWLTYRTFAYKSLIYPAALSIFMGLCFHQYPSGQTAVAIPWLYLMYLLIFKREHSWRFYGVRLGFLILGVAFWYYGSSLAYYLAYDTWSSPNLTKRFDSRVAWKSPEGSKSLYSLVSFMVPLILQNARELFGSMVYALELGMPPQDMVPTFSHVTSRTLFLLAPAFILVTTIYFIRNLRWNQGALLMAWVIAAAAPCLLSNQGYPRRAATIFPAFLCMAGIGYWLCRTMLADIWGKPWRRLAPCLEVPIAACLVLASVHQWFSTRTMRIAEPGDLEVCRTIGKMIQPGTLMFFDYDHHYMPGRMTYLLLDYLDKPENRPVSWAVINSVHPVFKPSVENPRVAPKLIKRSIEYRWSKLRHHIPEIENFNDWKKLIFISERMPTTKDVSAFDARLAMITAHCVNHKETVIPHKTAFPHTFTIIECDLPPAATAPAIP